MATRASARKARVSSKSEPESSPHIPQRWWQWILVYPTLALSLVSATPSWVNGFKSWAFGVKSAAEAERQAALWTKNASCVGLNSNGFLSPQKVSVDATICDSGDILVHAITPQKREVFKWLALDDVVRPASNGQGWLVSSAQAATLPEGLTGIRPAIRPPALKVALLQMVLCTRSNGRLLLRRIQTPQGCFDEVIDTFTGALVSRNPAPCVPSC